MTTQTADAKKIAPPELLESYVAGRFQSGSDQGTPLVNPSLGTAISRVSTKGIDIGAGLEYSRKVGGAELRKLSFQQRAELLNKVGDLLATRRDEWYEIARLNSGNTKADAAIDVDGAIGTVKYFAKLGAKLAEATILRVGGPARLAKDPNFQGLHIGVPLRGVAVHINAYNFPSWGLWEKAAVSLLAGVPVFAKPASSTAWLAQEMVSAVVKAEILPPGSLSILCGSPNDLLDRLQQGDLVAITGSADTGEKVRQHANVRKYGVRVNVEADSLNTALLGPDGAPGTPQFDFFVREVVREMTAKAGQKCTAIRRVIVPSQHAQAVTDAIAAALEALVVGNPENPEVKMGPVVNAAQKKSVEEGIAELRKEAEVAYQPQNFAPVDAGKEGSFVPPTLLRARDANGSVVHEVEVFGPVSTVVPYSDIQQAYEVVRRGGGSLVASVYSGDANFLAQAGVELGSVHGRIMLVDPSVGNSHTGHGIAMPSSIHGGPGRAGGGLELGGLLGLWFYHQQLTVQGSGEVLNKLVAQSADPYAP